jgi:FtsH-binding integral membrane protein
VTKTTELALAMFFLGVAVLAATATTEEPALPRLARLRVVGVVGAAVVIAADLVLPMSGFALGAAGLGLLLSVQALGLDRLRAARERTWHEQFELPFADYVRRAGR